MTLRAVVIDDEELARRRVCELVGESPALELVGEASDGASALDLLAETKPDVAFLDIQMPELDGFQTLAALEPEEAPAVVFVTAYDGYAIRAFEVGAHDYLLKPVTRERFDAAVARLGVRLPLREQSAQARALAVDMERERGFVRRLVARRGGRHYFVPVGDIDWLEADGNYLHVHASGRTHLVRYTVKDVEARLDPDRFVRIHRSTIVAIDRVGSIQTAEHGEWVITMPDGAKLRSSRSYAPRVRALLR